MAPLGLCPGGGFREAMLSFTGGAAWIPGALWAAGCALSAPCVSSVCDREEPRQGWEERPSASLQQPALQARGLLTLDLHAPSYYVDPRPPASWEF